MGIRSDLEDMLSALPGLNDSASRRAVVGATRPTYLVRQVAFEGSDRTFVRNLAFALLDLDKSSLLDFLATLQLAGTFGTEHIESIRAIAARVEMADATELRAARLGAWTEWRNSSAPPMTTAAILRLAEAILSFLNALSPEAQADFSRTFEIALNLPALHRAMQDLGAESILAHIWNSPVTVESEKLALERLWWIWMGQVRSAALRASFGTITRREIRSATYLGGLDLRGHTISSLDDAIEIAIAQSTVRFEKLYELAAGLEVVCGTPMPDSWFCLDPDELAGLRMRASCREPPATVHVVLDLASALNDFSNKDCPAQQMRVFYRGNGEAWDVRDITIAGVDGLKDALSEAIETCRFTDDGPTAIGLILRRMDISLLPDRWPVRDEFGGSIAMSDAYPVFLHSWERWKSSGQLKSAWRRYLSSVHQQLEHGVQSIRWLARDESTPAGLARVQADAPSCLGLGFALVDLDPADDPITAVIRAGVPYMLWFEADADDWNSVRQLLDEQFEGPFDEFAHRLHPFTHTHGMLPGAPRILWDDDRALPVREDFDTMRGLLAGHKEM